MEVIRNGLSPIQAEIGRQVGVATQHPGSRRANRRRIEMDHLTDAVNPGVGPTRAYHMDRLVGDSGQRPFQTGLYGARFGSLRLPAPEFGPVVLHA